MKSIERSFNNIKAKNPYWSTYICFSCAIIDRSYNARIINQWFYKLVDENDYAEDDIKEILSDLEAKTKRPEECMKQG